MRLLILTNRPDCLGENDAPIGNAFVRFGWQVIIGEINAIAADDYRFFTRGVLIAEGAKPHHVGAAAQGIRGSYFLDECELIWVINPPQPRVARDIWQLLWLASQHMNFVNSIAGMMFLDTKHALGHVVPKENRVISYTSNDFSWLWERYRESPDLSWVAKPPNGYSGQNVFLLPSGGPNIRTILQSLTGNADVQGQFGTLAQHEFAPATQDGSAYGLGGLKAEYAILQQYIPEVAHGEKRIVVVCGQVVAWHGRKGRPDDHRSNIAQGGKPIQVELHDGEIELAESVGKRLMTHGINFVGIDMAFPYVLELNIADAGGLYDSELATGKDRSDQVAELIISHFKNNWRHDTH
ncbi:glutathione synthase [Bradyrhizobium sp. JR1.5]|uniref:ATP-grasp domain-containing protein n=1 Tax=unclassified Bradyrhizobium TaxID=2631580 RepID=UPI003392506E